MSSKRFRAMNGVKLCTLPSGHSEVLKGPSAFCRFSTIREPSRKTWPCFVRLHRPTTTSAHSPRLFRSSSVAQKADPPSRLLNRAFPLSSHRGCFDPLLRSVCRPTPCRTRSGSRTTTRRRVHRRVLGPEPSSQGDQQPGGRLLPPPRRAQLGLVPLFTGPTPRTRHSRRPSQRYP